ncbi:hypothetical protein VTH82DRAFT_5995 [Thermothelomyces myriococcoides]
MAKRTSLLGLITGLLIVLSCTVALEITDIFTVQSGSKDGGCDDWAAVLDDWLTECIWSLDTTLDAIEQYNQQPSVRKAMSAIFGIANRGRISEGDGSSRAHAFTEVKNNIGWVRDFFRNEKDNHGAPIYSKDKFWLFCDSTFLSLHEPTDPASDYEGKEMLDQDDNPIRIVDVPEYQNHLAEDANNRPWWSGELTNLNAYYFTEYGGNYCYEDELGITAATLPLIRGDNGQAVVPENGQVASVILCPYNFDVDNPKPSSYLAANQLLESGRNLADAIPRSATLLHEAFHGLRGDAFLAGDAEKYDIATCLNLATSDPSSARINPENYVYFIAHMYHLFGTDEDGAPESIPTNWDFQLMGRGSLLRVFDHSSKQCVPTPFDIRKRSNVDISMVN